MWMAFGLVLVAAIESHAWCGNGVRDADESDIDCGGRIFQCAPGTPPRQCPVSCSRCEAGQRCEHGSDCRSRRCRPNNRLACFITRACTGTCEPSCEDGVQNGQEAGTDCGGECDPCPGGGYVSCESRGHCTMFVTGTNQSGEMNGLAGADATCNARAAAGGLQGQYQAWLCDGVTAPANRSMRASVPYLRTDGARIADHWRDLTDGNIQNPINRNEFGTQVMSPYLPWTYVKPDGTCDDQEYLSPGPGPCPAATRCKLTCAAEGDDHGWTSGSPWAQGAKGDVNTTESWWTDGVTGLCSEPAERIYCIEQ